MKNKSSSDPQEPMLLEHDADGIQELDNLLPRWWVWMFYICVAFSIGYLVYYHVLGVGDNQATEYAKAMRSGEQIKIAALGKFETAIGTMQPSADKAVLEKGSSLYAVNCAPCHRADAGGLVGPNLTDDYWIHGGSYGDTLKLIWNGVPEKGMVTWKGVLKPEEIEAVASYIYTLRGSNPAGAKAPENQAAAPSAPSAFE